jgi:hypothetical protein
MKKIQIIDYSNKNTKHDVKIKEIQDRENYVYFLTANNLTMNLSKIQDKSTEFASMEPFVDDDESEISILYKQWRIQIYTSQTLENDLNFIIPFIKYNVIFQEEANNNISYCSRTTDLQVSDFYEVNEDKLFLNVSLYIKKSYNGATLVVPNVKLRISIKNDLMINN